MQLCVHVAFVQELAGKVNRKTKQQIRGPEPKAISTSCLQSLKSNNRLIQKWACTQNREIPFCLTDKETFRLNYTTSIWFHHVSFLDSFSAQSICNVNAFSAGREGRETRPAREMMLIPAIITLQSSLLAMSFLNYCSLTDITSQWMSQRSPRIVHLFSRWWVSGKVPNFCCS